MNKFQTEGRLPSAHVDKVLLGRIEGLLLDNVDDLGPVRTKRADIKSHIRIEDAFGSETFPSVTEIPGTRFSDTTTRVGLHASGGKRDIGSIDVVFSTDREKARYLVRTSGPNARDRSLRIGEAIVSVVREQGSLGAFSGHPAATIVFLVFLCASFAAGSFGLEVAGEKIFEAGLILAILIGAGRYLWPYVEFDSPRLDLLRHGRKIALWILSTLVGAWIVIYAQRFF